MKELDWTGERLVTTVSDLHGVVEHLHRYALAAEICSNKIVVDIASGEGYGSALISKVASKVCGVDIDEKSVLHAKNKYEKAGGNLSFLIGSTSNIPVADNSADVLISFETLEHHDEHEAMMLEIKRVLKEDGVLLISSPEKSIYKDRDPDNPYHIKELTFKEFESLLSKHFKYANFFEQRFVIGSLVSLLGDKKSIFKTFDGDYVHLKKGLTEDKFYNRAFFNLCLSSDADLNDKMPGYSLFNGVNIVESERKKQLLSHQQLLNSYSFKFGNWFVRKLRFIKRLKK